MATDCFTSCLDRDFSLLVGSQVLIVANGARLLVQCYSDMLLVVFGVCITYLFDSERWNILPYGTYCVNGAGVADCVKYKCSTRTTVIIIENIIYQIWFIL